MLKRISIENFKSIKHAEIVPQPLSVICGPNASGKSNFAEAIDFISHVFREGLQYAVAEKGGFYNICFRRVRRTKGAIGFRIEGELLLSDAEEARYEINFSIRARSEAIRAQFVVEEEGYFFAIVNRADPAKYATLRITREGDRYDLKSFGDTKERFRGRFGFGAQLALENALPEFVKPLPQQLLLGASRNYIFGFLSGLRRLVREIDGMRVFQISPRIGREPGIPSIETGMGRHGENLAVALDSFLSRRELWRRLLTWTRDVVPSLEGWQTKYTETRQIGLFLEEKGFGAPWYAQDLSDGTIMSMALFMSLLEPTHRVVLIEEPENSLHPWALQRFLDRCREVSAERQIILTTHSPLVVSAARPDELFLIERLHGETQIFPAILRFPNLAEVIKKSALDLGEFWLAGGIGGVPEPTEVADRDHGGGAAAEENPLKGGKS